jgi:signal transduction histidine kinase/ActR/RegA family two-component response regulator
LITDRFHLGFDAEFDRSAAATRAKAFERVALSIAVLTVSVIAIGPVSLTWWAVAVLGEALLWRSTNPGFMLRRPGPARALRLVASTVASCAWVVCALLMWTAGSSVSGLMAIALLAAIGLYIIASCYETPIHMLAAGVPPAMGLLALPLLMSAELGDRILLGLSMALLVAFGISSATRSYLNHLRLMETRSRLEEQTRSAEAANRAKSEFLANMSHEIRTPLNGVLAISEALSRTELSDHQHSMLNLVSSSGRVLQQLFSDLLDIARIESAQMELHEVPFELRQAVLDVALLLGPLAEAKSLDFILDLDPEIDGSVVGDIVRFKQVLTNLIANAIKFTAEGHVRVTGGPDPSGVPARYRFTVVDTGVGFDTATAARLFTRFEQADGSITRRFGGSGLGLSICKQLAELMQGEVSCESEPGRGSTFSFSLPLTAHQPEEVAEIAPAPLTSKLRVLVADDHPTNRKVIELILSQTPVELVLVEDGVQAVAAVSDKPFDAILMDMQMPVMDGLTATQAIRRLETERDMARTLIIMLTANVLPEHIEQALAAGADQHIAKPFSAVELLGALSGLSPDAAARAAAAA